MGIHLCRWFLLRFSRLLFGTLAVVEGICEYVVMFRLSMGGMRALVWISRFLVVFFLEESYNLVWNSFLFRLVVG